MKNTNVVNLNSVPALSGIPLDQEQLNTAKEILNLFAESGYSIKAAMNILEFCKDSLHYSPVGTYEFEKTEESETIELTLMLDGKVLSEAVVDTIDKLHKE